MPDSDQQFESIREEMRDIRSVITKMADALAKLSVLEERNLSANAAIEKIAARVERAEEKIQTISVEQIKFASNIQGMTSVMKWMWAAFGGGVIYVGSELIKRVV